MHRDTEMGEEKENGSHSACKRTGRAEHGVEKGMPIFRR